MMKRILAFILIITTIFSIVSCGNVGGSKDESSESSSTADEVIKEESDIPEESSIPDENSNESLEESDASEESEEIIPQDTVISFYGCGDNMVHNSLYYDAIETFARENGIEPEYDDLHNVGYNFLPFYDFIKDDIADADISYVNQETLIGGDSKPISSYPRFNSPVAMGQAVVDLGFDVVNVAHNHMLDSGDTTFLEYSNNFFSSQGVKVLGYYPDEASTEDILIIEKEGIKVAFLTYTYGTNGIKVDDDSEFIIPYFEEALIEKQVAIAKEKADFVIVSCHWGHEYTYKPNSMQKEYAELLTNLEVDVVLGMHSHCIQPVEWQYSESGHKTLVVYSLGSMVSGIRKGMSALSGIVTFDIKRDGVSGEISIENPLFRPAILHYIRGSRGVSENDTGSRQFKVYYLEDYTEELADAHVIGSIERRDGVTTLVGGGFSLDTLYNTVYECIDDEFLPEWFPKENKEEAVN